MSFFIEVGDFVFWVFLSLGEFATLPAAIQHAAFGVAFPRDILLAKHVLFFFADLRL